MKLIPWIPLTITSDIGILHSMQEDKNGFHIIIEYLDTKVKFTFEYMVYSFRKIQKKEVDKKTLKLIQDYHCSLFSVDDSEYIKELTTGSYGAIDENHCSHIIFITKHHHIDIIKRGEIITTVIT